MACGTGSEAAQPPLPSTTSTTSTTTSTTSSTSTTSTSTTLGPLWDVGAAPLPRRPDGFGEIQPTPAALVDRALPTTDVLAPPATSGFESTISPIDDAIRVRIGSAWQEGCPVGIDELRYLTVSFVGFDGEAHTGELIVAAAEAPGIVSVFEQLFEAGFPIEEMRLVTGADLAAEPTGDGNNTAAFVCRPVRGGSRFSAHAHGLAIDINPFHNPYRRDDLVLPELASSYLDRDNRRPGMIHDGDVVVAAFESIGWRWGGRWRGTVDPMHFSATGG